MKQTRLIANKNIYFLDNPISNKSNPNRFELKIEAEVYDEPPIIDTIYKKYPYDVDDSLIRLSFNQYLTDAWYN